MDFHKVTKDLTFNTMPAIKYILNLPISLTDKAKRIQNVMSELGDELYTHMYQDISFMFDSGAIKAGGIDVKAELSTIGTKLARNDVLSRPLEEIVQEYFDMVLAKTENESFRNARSLQKHPTLTRRMVGETCGWCAKLEGVHVDPEPIYFARHDNCDCLITVSGYNSRNGVVNNYAKKGK